MTDESRSVVTDPGSDSQMTPTSTTSILQETFGKKQWGLLEALMLAASSSESSEYRARHVNDECSEAAAPLPGARKGTEYANVFYPKHE